MAALVKVSAASSAGQMPSINRRSRLTPRTHSSIRSARWATSSASRATSSVGGVTTARSRRIRAVLAMTTASRASVLASPANAPDIDLTVRPGT